ncbi:HAD-IA family hydrolase [Simiduia sp. 21SJ11W-1]|uniref:HAD family hydrolase n=1 Tax=Simiduia sp. 21SJ11W-1 TaxID=2909669 RepID=UPI0020A0D43B|nr:HAD-IA family hydrolase [Simiduia sp. 21SJ11W-1]UTA49516.1 HAD-IA family hydrolase [Simiduia sp. 21SJ11W-1]
MTERGFLFDLDGTLVDTAVDFVAVINHFRTAHKLSRLTTAEISPLVNGGGAIMTEASFGISQDHPGFAELQNQFLNYYEKVIGLHCHLYSGMDNLLAILEANHTPWGIVTNKHRRFATVLLERLGLRPNCLVCGDDIANGKPAPDALLLAAKKIGTPASALGYCGDHERDIAAGIAAGMHTISVAYGYLAPHIDVTTWGAHEIADSPQELAEQIISFVQGTH